MLSRTKAQFQYGGFIFLCLVLTVCFLGTGLRAVNAEEVLQEENLADSPEEGQVSPQEGETSPPTEAEAPPTGEEEQGEKPPQEAGTQESPEQTAEEDLQQEEPPAVKLEDDLLVKITLIDGKEEEFKETLDSLQLVLDETGLLCMVHVTLKQSGEKDTHLWYNFENIAKLSYQFLAFSGKSKVQLKMLHSFEQDDSMEQILSHDYR